MSRVLTFSIRYPSYHHKAGQPTEFVEKIHWGMVPMIHKEYKTACDMIMQLNRHLPESIVDEFINFMNDDDNFSDKIKHHTIRAGHRFKPGDKFSPRVWSGKPYNSKQIIIGPDIEVKKTWDFEMKPELWLDECKFSINKKWIDTPDKFREVTLNDGLSPYDFVNWFAGPSIASSNRKSFSGQIICWNDSINY